MNNEKLKFIFGSVESMTILCAVK